MFTPCTRCHGHRVGRFSALEPCSHCEGTGTEPVLSVDGRLNWHSSGEASSLWPDTLHIDRQENDASAPRRS
jgi:hypothetical protein